MCLKIRRRLFTNLGSSWSNDESIMPVDFVVMFISLCLSEREFSSRYHQSNHSRISDYQLAPDREIYASSSEYRIPQRVKQL